MSDRHLIRGLIALKFIGMVTIAVIYIGGPWTVAVILATGMVVFGLVGAPRGDGQSGTGVRSVSPRSRSCREGSDFLTPGWHTPFLLRPFGVPSPAARLRSPGRAPCPGSSNEPLSKEAKMFYEDENTVVVTGNLTRDVETRQSPGSTLVANIRIGVNGRRKVGDSWVDKPNFFTVTTFGKSAENAKKYLEKGRRILVKGRLDWSEYEKDGEKRQGVQIIAERIRYLPSKSSIEAQAAESGGQTTMPEMTTAAEQSEASPPAEAPAETQQPVGVGAGSEEEEAPF